jgi:hypothetical protein
MPIEQQFIAVPSCVKIVAFIRDGGETREKGFPMEQADLSLASLLTVPSNRTATAASRRETGPPNVRNWTRRH